MTADPGDLEGAQERFSPRASDLQGRAGENVHVALAPHTLEWALAQAGNAKVMIDALEPVKPKVAARLRGELADTTAEQTADAILAAVKDVKGQYAQELADLLAKPEIPFTAPSYLREAIAWVADEHDERPGGEDEQGEEDSAPGENGEGG
jgi:putative ATP-dependent endonuclease of the OLD family